MKGLRRLADHRRRWDRHVARFQRAGEIGGAGEAGGSGTDDCDLAAVGCCGCEEIGVGDTVGGVALEAADLSNCEIGGAEAVHLAARWAGSGWMRTSSPSVLPSM